MTESGFRVAVIGAGASGIATGIALMRAGIEDFAILEKASDLGGTWRDNSYPGLSCDVPSHLYRFSFAPNPDWTSHYSPGAEIQAYVRKVARDFDVERYIRYDSEVTRAVFEKGRWRLSGAQGELGLFDAVISATGVLHQPVYPDIAGLDRFAGSCFHSSRWDHGADLRGARVGIIGTGSTAIQILPAIVDEVAQVSLFQRTAQWIFDLPNPEIPEEKRARFRDHPEEMDALYAHLAARFNATFAAAVVGENQAALAEVTQACKDNLANNVHDPDLRARLTPDYRVGCKRLIVSDRFYPAIQKPNAALVDTAIDRIEPGGVRTVDGILHPLDVLVCATGFDPHAFVRPMTVIGRDGLSLERAWAEGNEAYRSVAIPDFPNFFLLGGPNSPIGNFSFLMTIETQLAYVMQLLELLRQGRAREVAPSHAATRAFNAELKASMSGTVWVTGCRSWYIDRNGNVASWPWTFERFQADLERPVLADFDMR